SIRARSNICGSRNVARSASRSRTRPGTNCARLRSNTRSRVSWVLPRRPADREKSMTRQMAMVGFLQAQNCTNLPSSWASSGIARRFDVYQEIAGILEADQFHMAFVDNRLAMPDSYGNDHAHTVEYGIRCVKG